MVESVLGVLNNTKYSTDNKGDQTANSLRSESFVKNNVYVEKVDRMNEEYLNNHTRWESKRVAFDNEGTAYVSLTSHQTLMNID